MESEQLFGGANHRSAWHEPYEFRALEADALLASELFDAPIDAAERAALVVGDVHRHLHAALSFEPEAERFLDMAGEEAEAEEG